MTSVPRQADLRKLAAACARIAGVVELSALPRLQGLLTETTGRVEVELQFGQDDEGFRVIEGFVRGAPCLQCQRCLGSVAVEIDARVCLAMVWGEEEIPSLPSRFEGVVVGMEPTDLYELIEEELLLALPLVPRHADGACAPSPLAGYEAAAEQKESPFAAVLRGKGKE